MLRPYDEDPKGIFTFGPDDLIVSAFNVLFHGASIQMPEPDKVVSTWESLSLIWIPNGGTKAVWKERLRYHLDKEVFGSKDKKKVVDFSDRLEKFPVEEGEVDIRPMIEAMADRLSGLLIPPPNTAFGFPVDVKMQVIMDTGMNGLLEFMSAEANVKVIKTKPSQN